MKRMLSAMLVLVLLALCSTASCEALGELKTCLGAGPEVIASMLESPVLDDGVVSTGDLSVLAMTDDNNLISYITVTTEQYTLFGFQCGMALNVVRLTLQDQGLETDDSALASDGLLYASSADHLHTLSFLFDNDVLTGITALTN